MVDLRERNASAAQVTLPAAARRLLVRVLYLFYACARDRHGGICSALSSRMGP
jgi:hypothetical protein